MLTKVDKLFWNQYVMNKGFLTRWIYTQPRFEMYIEISILRFVTSKRLALCLAKRCNSEFQI